MRIEQIMRHDPTRVGPDESVENLIGWYANPGNRSRYSYVVDGRGVLLGVVTMMELLGLFLTPELVAQGAGELYQDREAQREMMVRFAELDRRYRGASSLMARAVLEAGAEEEGEDA